MAKNRRKSAAIALAVIGVAGLSLASASTLGIDAGTLQAGTKVLTDCQTGNVTAKVAAGAYDATLAGFKAGDVTVSGINVAANGCTGKSISVALLDASDAQIGTTLTGSIAAASVTLTNSGAALAEDVAGVAVVISD
jgi:hypothetical protein